MNKVWILRLEGSTDDVVCACKEKLSNEALMDVVLSNDVDDIKDMFDSGTLKWESVEFIN